MHWACRCRVVFSQCTKSMHASSSQPAQLCVAAAAGDLLAVLRLLAAGAPPNEAAAPPTPPSAAAAAEDLHEAGDCASALHLAVQGRRDVRVVKALLDAGAAPSAGEARWGSALHVAAGAPFSVAAEERRAVAVAEELLARGCAIDDASAEGGNTPLHVAAAAGHCRMVALLLSRGADAAAENGSGQTALHVAARFGRADACAQLLDAGLSADAADRFLSADGDGRRTPLMHAAHFGCLRTVRLLLRRRCDLHALSASHWPALFYAVEASKRVSARGGSANPHVGVAKLLLAAAATDEACTDLRGRTALMVAALQDADEAAAMLCTLQPGCVNLRDAGGRTALHYAALRGAAATCEVLLKHGAQPEARDKGGQRPGDLFPAFTRPPVQRQWEQPSPLVETDSTAADGGRPRRSAYYYWGGAAMDEIALRYRAAAARTAAAA